jgi:hypothetical protein
MKAPTWIINSQLRWIQDLHNVYHEWDKNCDLTKTTWPKLTWASKHGVVNISWHLNKGPTNTQAHMWFMLEFLQKNFTTRLNVDIGLQTLIKILTPPLSNGCIASTITSIGRVIIKNYYNYIKSWNRCWGHNTSNDRNISGWLI